LDNVIKEAFSQLLLGNKIAKCLTASSFVRRQKKFKFNDLCFRINPVDGVGMHFGFKSSEGLERRGRCGGGGARRPGRPSATVCRKPRSTPIFFLFIFCCSPLREKALLRGAKSAALNKFGGAA
jgi:hypothetical protein